jgi:putative ATP-dependent endonuclease of OLD family
MLITRLEISNFRSLKSIDLECGGLTTPDPRSLTAILGRNGGGKSSILYALDVFYDTGARITVEDCYARDSANEIMIRVTYGRLRQEERDEFATYIDNDVLIVTKRITVGEGSCIQKYFAAAKQIPQFAEIRKLSKKSDQTSQFKRLVTEKMLDGLAGSPRSADEALKIMAEYESAHSDLLVTVQREEQFFGPKDVGGGKLDKFTKFVLVPAVRLASVEVQKKGVIHELISMIVLRRVNKRADVKALRAEMEAKIKLVFSQENLTELTELGASISTLLQQYAPGASLKLTWGNAITPIIPLPDPKADLVEDDFPCPITHAGHGLQRALVLTLLQQLAMTQRPDDDEDEEPPIEAVPQQEAALPPAPPAEPKEDAIVSPDLILAIEEPELYLHPSRCRYLSELLLKLAEPPKKEFDPSNQIIYATHSPYFVDLHRFDQVRIARKPRIQGQPAPCCAISQYSLEKAAKELARVANGKPEDFTRDSFRARSLPVMTIAVNEGFFANTVVVVEGLSDVGILWRLQEIMKENWSALGISVVPAIGKENIDRPVVVFRGLKIPTYFIFDGDNRHKGKKGQEDSTKARNRRYQRLAGVAEPRDFPPTTIRDDWAVVENDIEAIIRNSVGSEFDDISQQAADELKYDGASMLMKNTEGAARLVELIYEKGKKLDLIEEIVKKVTSLHHSSGKVDVTAEPIGAAPIVIVATAD